MKNIVVGEKVVNKTNEVGTIVGFDDKYIYVDYKKRSAKLICNAFELGFIKYENADLQAEFENEITKEKKEKEKIAQEKRIIAEKDKNDLRKIQADLSRKHFRVAVASANIRLEAAPISFNLVRKKDQDLIKAIFEACDQETEKLYDTVDPEMIFIKRMPQGLR